MSSFRFIYSSCVLLLFISCSHSDKEKALSSNTFTDSLKRAENAVSNKASIATTEDEISETDQPHEGCGYQNETSLLGIGILLAPDKCKIYNDPDLTDLYYEWNFAYEGNEPPPGACALYYKPDYGIAHYVCLDSAAKYYRILVNGNQEKYVPRLYGKIFNDWFTYISGSVGGIDLPHPQKDFALILLDSPGGSQVVYTDRSIDAASTSLCPLEMEGDWLKVKIDCYTFDENPHQGEPCRNYVMDDCRESKMGWIRWKQGNKILIGIHQLL